MATKKRPPQVHAGNQAARVMSVGTRGTKETTARPKSVPARVHQPSDKIRKVR